MLIFKASMISINNYNALYYYVGSVLKMNVQLLQMKIELRKHRRSFHLPPLFFMLIDFKIHNHFRRLHTNLLEDAAQAIVQ